MPAYDHTLRRRATRPAAGRQKGVYVYVPASEIRRAGLDPELVTHYRVWGGKRGGILLRLYKGDA